MTVLTVNTEEIKERAEIIKKVCANREAAELPYYFQASADWATTTILELCERLEKLEVELDTKGVEIKRLDAKYRTVWAGLVEAKILLLKIKNSNFDTNGPWTRELATDYFNKFPLDF